MKDGISQRLATIRKSLGKSQREMAIIVTLSHRGWQVIENGKSIPGGQTLEKLMELGFSSNWILTGQGSMRLNDPEPAEAQQDIDASREEPSKPLEAASNKALGEVDGKLLGKVLKALDNVYKETGFTISMSSLGEMAMEKAMEIAEASSDPEQRAGAISLMALQVRKELLKPASDPGRSKLSA